MAKWETRNLPCGRIWNMSITNVYHACLAWFWHHVKWFFISFPFLTCHLSTFNFLARLYVSVLSDPIEYFVYPTESSILISFCSLSRESRKSREHLRRGSYRSDDSISRDGYPPRDHKEGGRIAVERLCLWRKTAFNKTSFSFSALQQDVLTLMAKAPAMQELGTGVEAQYLPLSKLFARWLKLKISDRNRSQHTIRDSNIITFPEVDRALREERISINSHYVEPGLF